MRCITNHVSVSCCDISLSAISRNYRQLERYRALCVEVSVIFFVFSGLNAQVMEDIEQQIAIRARVRTCIEIKPMQ
jgi:hypothetical protein